MLLRTRILSFRRMIRCRNRKRFDAPRRTSRKESLPRLQQENSFMKKLSTCLSEARRAGMPLPPPKYGRTKESTRKSAERDYEAGQSGKKHAPSVRASRARQEVLEHEPRTTASHSALSKQ